MSKCPQSKLLVVLFVYQVGRLPFFIIHALIHEYARVVLLHMVVFYH
jgi:hypothetical protein